MISEGEVGAVLTVVDRASPVLREIAAQFEKIDVLARKAQVALDSFRLPSGVSAAIGRVSAQFEKIGVSSENASRVVSGALGRIDARLAATESRALALVRTLGETRVGGIEGAPGIRGISDAKANKLAANFEKVGMAADTSADRVTAALGRMDAGLTTTETRSAALVASLKEVGASLTGVRAGGAGGYLPGGGGTRVPGGGGGGHGGGGVHVRGEGIPIPGGHIGVSKGGDGFWELIGGVALAEFAKKFTEAGLEMDHWTAQMKAAGADQKTISDAVGASWENAGKNLNTTATEGVKNIIELNKATGNWKESMDLLPTFSVAQNAMQSVKAEDLNSKFKAGTQVLNFARGLEELGVTQMGKTPEERQASVTRYANELLRTMISSRGLFDGNSLYAMTNNSGGAAQNWDMRFATTIGPIIGDIMKASKFGNADYMALKSYAGGHITSDAVVGLMKYGLTEEGDTYQDKKGWHLKPNSKFAEGMMENLWDWSGAKLDKLRGAGFDPTNQKQMAEMVNEIGSNKSTGAMMRALFEPLVRQQIGKEIELRDKVPVDAASVLQGQDPTLKIAAFKEKWNDLMTALGGPLTENAMAALTALTKTISTVAQTLHENPALAAIAADGISAAGAVLLFAGSLAVLKVALSGFSLFGGLFGGGAKAAGAAAAAGEASAAGLGAAEGAASGLLKGGLKGGIVGGIVAYAGDKLLNWLLPVTPQQRDVMDHPLAHLMKDLGGPNSGNATSIPRNPTGVPSFPSSSGVSRGGNLADKVLPPSGQANVSATLQAQVSTTVPFTVNVDGQAVATAIMPRITQMIRQEMSALAGQLMGHTNEVAAYHSAGIGHN